MLSPAPSFSRMCSTVMRVPRTTGLPIITVGLHSMKSFTGFIAASLRLHKHPGY